MKDIMNKILSPERVDSIYGLSLYQDGEVTGTEVPEDAIIVEGIMSTTGFNPEHIAKYHSDIVEMLHELPREFLAVQLGGGGGWSFLNACNTKDGEQWTGFHQTMDRLFQLGMAIKAVVSPFDRDMWGALPGGMPYYIVVAVMSKWQSKQPDNLVSVEAGRWHHVDTGTRYDRQGLEEVNTGYVWMRIIPTGNWAFVPSYKVEEWA